MAEVRVNPHNQPSSPGTHITWLPAIATCPAIAPCVCVPHLYPVHPDDPVLLILPGHCGAQGVRVLQELVSRGVGAVMNL